MADYDVHGVRAAVDSNWPRFDELVRLNLGAFAAGPSSGPRLTIHVELVRREWLASLGYDRSPPSTGQTWGTDLSLDGAKVTYRKRHVSVEYAESAVSRVRASYEVDRKSRIRGFVRDLPSWEECQLVMRLAVYDPIFHLLEREGFRLLHSAAVADERGSLLLMGLNGSGKSSLCHALLNRFQYMSDNFLLWKQNEVYAFPETLRLPLAADPSLPRLPYPTVYGKRLVPVPTAKTRMRSTPRALVFVVRNHETAVEPLSKGATPRHIRMIADMTHEFPRYGFLGLLSDYHDSSAEELANAVEAFILRMSDVHRASDLISEVWSR